jgi:signal transduction histidine kinase
MEQRTAVLKPYVRLESSRNRETGGSGLGLAIVCNVLRRHAGGLEFLDLKDGFTARVTLPMVDGSSRPAVS